MCSIDRRISEFRTFFLRVKKSPRQRYIRKFPGGIYRRLPTRSDEASSPREQQSPRTFREYTGETREQLRRARTIARAGIRVHSSSLTSYLGKMLITARSALAARCIMVHRGKIIGRSRPRSLWRHYPVRLLKVYFLPLRCVCVCIVRSVDCGASRRAVPSQRRANAEPSRAESRQAGRQAAVGRTDEAAKRRRLPLRHLSLIRLTTDRHVSTIVLPSSLLLSSASFPPPRVCNAHT